MNHYNKRFAEAEKEGYGVQAGSYAAFCVFRLKPASSSGLNLPPIPVQSCHPFRVKPAIF